MGKPTLKYVEDALGRAIASALYEEYVQQSIKCGRSVPGVYARHGHGALMARMDAHGTWVVVTPQWGVKADVPKRIVRRALEVYRTHNSLYGHLVSDEEVRLVIRLSYTRSQARNHFQTKKSVRRSR